MIKKTCINIEEDEVIINSKGEWDTYYPEKYYSPFYSYAILTYKNNKYQIRCLE